MPALLRIRIIRTEIRSYFYTERFENFITNAVQNRPVSERVLPARIVKNREVCNVLIALLLTIATVHYLARSLTSNSSRSVHKLLQCFVADVEGRVISPHRIVARLHSLRDA